MTPKRCAWRSRACSPRPDGATPAHVAERTLEAIRAGEFWIIPNGGERPIVEARFTEALASFPDPGDQ